MMKTQSPLTGKRSLIAAHIGALGSKVPMFGASLRNSELKVNGE